MRAEDMLPPIDPAAVAAAEAARVALMIAEADLAQAEEAMKSAQKAYHAVKDAHHKAQQNHLDASRSADGTRPLLAWLRENRPHAVIVVRSDGRSVGMLEGGGSKQRRLRRVVWAEFGGHVTTSDLDTVTAVGPGRWASRSWTWLEVE